jgi:hypothetical protein
MQKLYVLQKNEASFYFLELNEIWILVMVEHNKAKKKQKKGK